MKGGYQRRALPAVSHISAAEIPDCHDIGQRGNPVVIPELHGKRCFAVRLMPDGLSVTTDAGNILRIQPGLCQQPADSVSKQCAQFIIQTADF